MTRTKAEFALYFGYFRLKFVLMGLLPMAKRQKYYASFKEVA